MKWSRELRTAGRSLRTAVKAASAIAAANVRLPSGPWSMPAPATTPLHPGLEEVPDFGSNPGRLAMLTYLPAEPPRPQAPLIVLLHGCGQTAASFAQEAGWMALAQQLGIPLVLPEQSDENNRGRCFNWFRPVHTGRGMGEALSIRQMVTAAIDRFDADPSRVFIAGLSAGGAMTAAMLAAYPDVFAGGAVVAGLPVGAASSTSEALRRMAAAGPERPPQAWADQVRLAAPIGYAGPWPLLSIWHGGADRVVDPTNGRLIATQWAALHGLATTPGERVEFLDTTRARWRTDDRPVVELWSLPDWPHAWPRGAVDGIADFWGLVAD